MNGLTVKWEKSYCISYFDYMIKYVCIEKARELHLLFGEFESDASKEELMDIENYVEYTDIFGSIAEIEDYVKNDFITVLKEAINKLSEQLEEIEGDK